MCLSATVPHLIYEVLFLIHKGVKTQNVAYENFECWSACQVTTVQVCSANNAYLEQI